MSGRAVTPTRYACGGPTNPDYGIALHCGRSGAIVFDLDVDSLDAFSVYGRDDIADALLGAGAIHGTRRDGDRGHYIFLMPEDADFGNGAGKFMICGDVRGKNGVIIAPPTPHPDAETKGGDYNQRKTGVVGPLPDVLRACLTEAGESADPLTDAELDAFLDAHTGDGCGRDGCRHTVNGPVTKFCDDVGDGASRHDSLVKVAPWAMSEAMAGCYSAREAFGQLHAAFMEWFGTGDKPERVSQLGDEYMRIMKWAAAQADPERAHRNDQLLTADRAGGVLDRTTDSAAYLRVVACAADGSARGAGSPPGPRDLLDTAVCDAAWDYFDACEPESPWGARRPEQRR